MKMQRTIAEYAEIIAAFALGVVITVIYYENMSLVNKLREALNTFDYIGYFWQHDFAIAVILYTGLLGLGTYWFIVEITTPVYQQKAYRKYLCGIMFGLSIALMVASVVFYYA